MHPLMIWSGRDDPDWPEPESFWAYDPHFERVRQISEYNETLYRTFVSPWVQAAFTPWSAALMKWLHPMRTSRYLLSEKFSPWMHAITAMAEQVRKHRITATADSPFRATEGDFSAHVTKTIEAAREQRDKMEEAAFQLLYGSLATAKLPRSSTVDAADSRSLPGR